MSKFQQSTFTVGSNSGESLKKYLDNYDKVFKKSKDTKKDGHKGRKRKDR